MTKEHSAGRSRIHAEKMAGAATGARIDLNTAVETTVVSVATSLTRSWHSRRNLPVPCVGTVGACGLRVAQPSSVYEPRDPTSTIFDRGLVRAS